MSPGLSGTACLYRQDGRAVCSVRLLICLMQHYLARRAAGLLATLAVATLLIFLALEVLPGNAAQMSLGPDAPPEAVAALTTRLGLDLPAWQRYLQWLSGLLSGQLGDSHAYNIPVADLIAERMALTLPLALAAMALTILLALAAGIYAALRHGRSGDLLVMGICQLGLAVPGFWLGILLIIVFAVQLQWFQAGGFPGWQNGPLAALQALVLPAIALALVQAAVLARITRAAVLDVLREDYVRTAMAKGLPRHLVLARHVLRNALIPILTIAGLQFAHLLAGAIVIENVFNLPGLGRLILQSIANRDLVVVRNAVLFLALMVICVNFLADLACGLADPRKRRALA